MHTNQTSTVANCGAPEFRARTPRAIWLLIAMLALTQPLVHGLCLYFPPEGTVATGLHIPDSALFLHAMGMFPTGFHSAYATCQAAAGDASIAYYSVPHLWLYGGLGLIARVLPLDPFLTYGIANGLGAAFYLWVVFRLLLVIVPRFSVAAFVLFTLSGGPGGLLYLIAGLFGLHGHSAFEVYFHRFAVYDLMEGPHLNPVLYFPRLYYTLSLACCLGGLGSIVGRMRWRDASWPWGWMIAIAVGSFLDARYTVFTFGLLALFLACERSCGGKTRWRALAAYGLPGGAGFLVAAALMRLNPAVVENHLVVGNMAMWFSPFVVVTWLHWLAGGRVLWRGAQMAPLPARVLLFAGMGYLAAFSAGYVVYQGFYGNLLAGRDGSVAAAISDWALIGGVAGVAWSLRGGQRLMAQNHDRDACATFLGGLSDGIGLWLLLWLIGFTALSLSGFGQGWFLQFGPQRLQVFIWLPLCIVTAMGLAHFSQRTQRVAWSLLLGCGLSSVAVAVLAFQSPLGRADAQGPFAALHTEVMRQDDGRLIEAIGEGWVLAPSPAGDVVVRLKGNPVVYGIGTFNLTDQPYSELREEVEVFFDARTPDAVRRDIAARWCVAWVYCPATWPVDPAVRGQLRASTWLEVAAEAGDGMLLRVRRDGGTGSDP
ncbi:MAG: hypothetical protein JNK74_14435 [Candidatus Hydrogenedentes bacterium]|nr:hypothetical protein [Candidatus Hydrogenedentota bacterium]